MSKFDKKYLWHFLTVCGFVIGWCTGWWILSLCKPSSWLQITFWVFPIGGAGFGMSFGQWILIRQVYKNAYLWIPITTIGTVACMGGILIIAFAIQYSFEGRLSAFFMEFSGWDILFPIIAPAATIVGPFFQWLVMRRITIGQSFKELIKITIGWIIAILLLGVMFHITAPMNDNISLYLLIPIPSGLFFSLSTLTALHTPQNTVVSSFYN
jgi:hypothetical protein